jgi:hypothetical protein
MQIPTVVNDIDRQLRTAGSAGRDRFAGERTTTAMEVIGLTVPLNQKSHGGTGDTNRTVEICALVAEDRDDMVAKGLSWALRTLVPHDVAAVVRFLETHRVPARVRREVGNKLATGRKSPGI